MTKAELIKAVQDKHRIYQGIKESKKRLLRV